MPMESPLKFVRAARYQSLMTSGDAYTRLHDAVLGDERLSDIGMARFIYQGIATILVTARETLPDDVVALVEAVLAETGEPWAPTDEVVACIVLRQDRQVATGEAKPVGDTGAVELHRRGQFQRVDQYGQDID